IYMFIFSIIRLIYLDIKGMDFVSSSDYVYLKLINRKESLPYKINEYYNIDEELSLGRRGSNDIIIKDPFVSKNHFQIVKDEGNFFLEDLNSSNGTYLNEEIVLDAIELKNGDMIKIGNIEFLFVNKGDHND
ncbi:MAG TPA: FHA domain-containing protein, partial [Tissierellaceae bacterium]|nr:FHA domain-containing protein [Tissierellaceae bacterium]